MKKLFVLIPCLAFVLNAGAQDTRMQNPQVNVEKYCASIVDGKMVVLRDKTAVTTEVVLANGNRLNTEGVITSRDNVRTLLKNGECVDSNGNIEIVKSGKEKMKSEKANQMKEDSKTDKY